MAKILNPAASLADIGKHSVKRIIHAVTDSQNFADNVDNDAGASADKRVRIVVAMLREAFSLAENAYLTWVPTWRTLADALAKLVCGSMLRAALSGQQFTASPPVKREPASAKMPTRAPSALAGQVVKTLVTSSLVKTAAASSDAMEAFTYLGDIYLIVKIPYRFFSILMVFTLSPSSRSCSSGSTCSLWGKPRRLLRLRQDRLHRVRPWLPRLHRAREQLPRLLLQLAWTRPGGRYGPSSTS